ncbi:hypothetical protein JRQ81_009354 [Phrynocephalus forsythii]|uniref:Ephrin-A1 n=1 Tax=Phrynocephalus forsythii TaxID=171643 RepID=A0A9Q0X9M9_9SAUR|nr:hypothetical protein JRQ81_009354 [Phrynocephalus forsythii]
MELPLIGWAPLVSLWCVLCGASGDRHTVFWNSTNPRFQRDNYAVEVRLNDYLDIICPHYEDQSVAPHAMERYTLYLILAKSSKKEFQEGHEYYYICEYPWSNRLCVNFVAAKPIHRHGEACLKLRVMVARKKGHTLPVPNPTQKGKLQSDDPDAPMLRSMGHNSAPRPSSPFTFLGLLPPLLLLLMPRGP